MSARRSLEGQVAVVTGAARGVGELLARKLSARGAKVALVGLEPEALKEVSERLHTDSDHWHADVTDHEAMARVAQEVKERFGKVDIVVANAGVAAGGPFADSDPDAWRRVIEVNLIGGAVTARAFLPVLTESRGYFLQIASLAAITPAPMMTAYCASSPASRPSRTACAPKSATRASRWASATSRGPTPTWCAAPTRTRSCGSCGSGCPGRRTARTRWARPWTGSWRHRAALAARVRAVVAARDAGRARLPARDHRDRRAAGDEALRTQADECLQGTCRGRRGRRREGAHAGHRAPLIEMRALSGRANLVEAPSPTPFQE